MPESFNVNVTEKMKEKMSLPARQRLSLYDKLFSFVPSFQKAEADEFDSDTR